MRPEKERTRKMMRVMETREISDNLMEISGGVEGHTVTDNENENDLT